MRAYLLTIALAGCAASAGDATDTTDATDGVTDALSVRAGDTTVTVDRAVARRGNQLVLHGKTSRTLVGGNGYIADDPYGDFVQVSPRVFELAWGTSEAAMLVRGTNQFIGLGFVASKGKADNITAHVIVRPRLATFTGSMKIYLVSAIAPVIEAGLVAYRITGHTSSDNTDVIASVGDVHRTGARAFTIDLTLDQAFATTPLTITTMLATGGVQKTATLGFEVASLDATTADAYETWPAPTCTPAVQTCLAALPDGTLDTASCGVASATGVCSRAVGVVIDATATTAAAAATTVSHADAVGLVGAARADAWLAAAKRTAGDALAATQGRWLLSATARTTVLGAARDTAIDAAYARPLALVPAIAANPTDAAAMRNFAADAVLTTIATESFAELSQTLEQLARTSRTQHVADIRAFRETITAQPYPGTPAWDYYEGSWLGLHTEVVVVHATGALVRTLVEID